MIRSAHFSNLLFKLIVCQNCLSNLLFICQTYNFRNTFIVFNNFDKCQIQKLNGSLFNAAFDKRTHALIICTVLNISLHFYSFLPDFYSLFSQLLPNICPFYSLFAPHFDRPTAAHSSNTKMAVWHHHKPTKPNYLKMTNS